MRLPRKRWLVVGVVLAVVAVILVAQDSVVATSDFVSYAVTSARTITVRVGVAPCSWTRVTGVEETATEVQVRIATWPCLQVGAGTEDLAFRDLDVSLQADLGSRVVEDATSEPIHMRTADQADEVATSGDGFADWLVSMALVVGLPVVVILLLLRLAWRRGGSRAVPGTA